MTMMTVEQRLRALPTTALSDATGGHTNIGAQIKPLANHFKIAGRALTVRLPDGENRAVLEAISKANKGDILVIDAKGNTNRAVAGDFVMQLAQGVGVQGFVVCGYASCDSKNEVFSRQRVGHSYMLSICLIF